MKKNNKSKYSYGFKWKYDTNGNKSFSLYFQDTFIGYTNGLDFNNKTDVHIITNLIAYFHDHGTANQKKKLSSCSYFSLDDVKTDGLELDHQSIYEIGSLIGGHAKAQTRSESCLRYGISAFPYWFRERVYYCVYSKGWNYCTGQDKASEMAEVRKQIK